MSFVDVRRSAIRLAAAVLLVALAAPAVRAQVSAGGDVVYNGNITAGSWGLGGRVAVQLPNLGFASWKLIGGGAWYFPRCGIGTCNWSEVEATLVFASPTRARVAPYLGGGVTRQMVKLSGDGTDNSFWGMDLLVGTPLGELGPVIPYAEVRYKVMETVPNQFAFLVGFGIGG